MSSRYLCNNNNKSQRVVFKTKIAYANKLYIERNIIPLIKIV